MFRPDWKLVVLGDAEYVEGVVKYAARAYGVDDLRHLPVTAPDDRSIPSGLSSTPGWSIARIPNDNSESSRFIATRL